MFKKLNEQFKNSKRCRTVVIVLVSILLVFAIATCTVFVLLEMGRNKLLNQENESIVLPSNTENTDSKNIIYNGQKYKYNENVTSILLMGIDKEKLSDTASNTYGENGQADLLVLISLDTSNGNMKAIPISRDTMIDINLYSQNGQYVGVSNKQICLSYAYGDGREKSCENTVKSVSRLLYGMPINSYVSIDINSIGILNDAINGVTLTIDEDINQKYFKVKKGDVVTLKGANVLRYIRARDKDDIEANNVRMRRQKNYMRAFYKQIISKTKTDITTPIKLYNKISNHSISNLSIADITYLTKCILTNRQNDTIKFNSIPGKTVAGEKYVEFYPDKDKLYELVINTFYTPCN